MPSIFSKIITLAVCLILISCGSKPAPKVPINGFTVELKTEESVAGLVEALQQKYKHKFATSVAGPDETYLDGTILQSEYLANWAVGLNWAAEPYSNFSSKEDAQKAAQIAAIKACEFQVGTNQCFIWYIDGINVIKVKYEEWTAQFPSFVILPK